MQLPAVHGKHIPSHPSLFWRSHANFVNIAQPGMHTTNQLNSALAGRYAVERLIGEGGMATVYLARDLRHQRKVALKVLKSDLGAILGVDRFLSEIQVTANLQHPNLLPLFDSGTADSLLFYVMPYVEGESLRARLDREKQLPLDEAVRIATSVASALDYAHRHGVIHRDLKPENILLHEGQPLVADFGIALAVRNAGGNRITQTGLSLGTPQYMSPEQATSDRTIDARSDIYSLGAVTYEMLTGEPPHTGSTAQAIIARLLTEHPRAIRAQRPHVSEQIEAAVERALEKLPADRWATAKEFSEALAGARVVVRAPSSAGRVSVASDARSTSGIATADYSVFVNRRISVRDLAALALALVGVATLVMSVLRAKPREAMPAAAMEFPIQLPESVTVRSVGSGGGAAAIAISEDGKVVVFQGVRPDGGMALYSRYLDEQVVTLIRGSDSATAPSLSPDGEQLLFSPFRRGSNEGSHQSVMVVATRGGIPRVLIDTASSANSSWGNSGQIVFVRRQMLWTIPATHGKAAPLAALDSSRRHVAYGYPDILPGGRAALITIRIGSQLLDSTFLGIVSIPDGIVTELNIPGTYPRYSSTGHILYATRDEQLMAVEFSIRTNRIAGDPFPVAESVLTGPGGAAAFAVSQNGTLVYLAGIAPGGEKELVIVDRQGIERDTAESIARYSLPRVSADGRNIAIAVSSTAGRSDIWMIDAGLRSGSPFTSDGVSSSPAWSADAGNIASLLTSRTQADTVVMQRPLFRPGQPQVLVHMSRTITGIAFSPRGDYIALTVRSSTSLGDIWLVHKDSLSMPRPFVAEPYEEHSPRISPDGNFVAYVVNKGRENEIFIRPVNGTGEEQLVDRGVEPVWNSTGGELFYRGGDSIRSVQFRGNDYSVKTARREQLFDDVYSRALHGNYDVFPGGQQFVMLKTLAREFVPTAPTVVANWLAKARKDRQR